MQSEKSLPKGVANIVGCWWPKASPALPVSCPRKQRITEQQNDPTNQQNGSIFILLEEKKLILKEVFGDFYIVCLLQFMYLFHTKSYLIILFWDIFASLSWHRHIYSS
jgi:hypothetical protein